jgi:hypothetical protein
LFYAKANYGFSGAGFLKYFIGITIAQANETRKMNIPIANNLTLSGLPFGNSKYSDHTANIIHRLPKLSRAARRMANALFFHTTNVETMANSPMAK